jgi:hypothetical protein
MSVISKFERFSTAKKIFVSLGFGCGLFIALIVVIAVIATISGGRKNKEVKSNASAKLDPPENYPLTCLAGSIDSFCYLFNYFADNNFKHGINLNVKKPSMDGRTFKYQFEKNLAMVGILNNDSAVSSVTIIFAGEGKAQVSDLLSAFVCTIYATNPGLLIEERGQIMRGLGLDDNNTDFKNYNRSIVVGRVKYFILTGSSIGVWMGAELPKN